MTPMNATAAGGMPAYDPYAGSTDALAGDPYEGMAPEEGLPPHVTAGGSFDPAYAPAATAYDPHVVEHYDPYARSVDPYAAAYEAQQHAGVGALAPVDASAVAPMQPGLGAPQATVDDFAALGIFTPDELQALAGSGMSPSDLGLLYHDIVSYLQTPEGQAELQSRMAAAAQQAAAQVAPVEASGEPGWNDEWAKRFRDVFKEQGLDSQTQLVLLQQLRSMELPEAALQQAFDHYATTPEGKAELQAVDEQVRAAAGNQGKLLLAMGGLTLGLTAIPIGIARSEGNLVRTLEASAKRAIANGSDDAARAAARVLMEVKTPASDAALRNLRTTAGGRAGTLFDDVARLGADEASRVATTMLRGDATATRRAVHPIRKMQLNGAARHLTPSTRLPAREALKYGLGMRFGDTVADTAAAAGAATRGVTGGGAAATARTAATVGRAGGIARALGPIGLVAGTALGVWSVNKTMDAEGGFGRESAKLTGNVAGGLAGGVAGAAAGAAIGSVVPVIGTGIGAIAGGIIGGLGGSFGGEKAGGGLFDRVD